MNPRQERVFDTWAPADAAWSQWVKPVLFAHVMDRAPSFEVQAQEIDASWSPPADGQTAIVVDLPGPRSVWMGLALARRGYRPVPLFNAVLGLAAPTLGIAPLAARELVDVSSIIDALVLATPQLQSLVASLPLDAPPAFLLDSARRFARFLARPGDFDNRSVSLPTDFPSSNLILSRGIKRVLLITANDDRPQEDLAHTLVRWQQAGIEIVAVTVDASDAEALRSPRPIRVARPSGFRAAWHNLLSRTGLKRSPLGGYGGTLQEPSSG